MCLDGLWYLKQYDKLKEWKWVNIKKKNRVRDGTGGRSFEFSPGEI